MITIQCQTLAFSGKYLPSKNHFNFDFNLFPLEDICLLIKQII